MHRALPRKSIHTENIKKHGLQYKRESPTIKEVTAFFSKKPLFLPRFFAVFLCTRINTQQVLKP